MGTIAASADILHISDLHLTEQYDTLAGLWLKANKAIAKRKFDFIVISGDLTQRALSTEYGMVSELITNHLLEKLNAPDKSRIIIVPGNHDICWETCRSALTKIEIKPKTKNWKSIAREIKNFNPNLKYRIEHNDNGRYTVYEISDATKYRQRFRNFQVFYDDFYKDAKLHHGFKLTDYEMQGQDFSIHVFEDKKVIFAGFNSCHRNDSIFRGASVNPHAIDACFNQIKQFRNQGYLIIGVWHHGLRSCKGSWDYLEVSEVLEYQLATDQGCHIGLHGHTHKSELTEIKKFNPNLFVFGTGSLCAGDNERPGAVGKQFSLIHVNRNKVRHDVYEFKNDRFSLSADSTTLHFDSKKFFVNQTFRPDIEVEKNYRRWKVSNDGMAAVTVELDGLSTRKESEIPLASIIPPFGAAIVEKNVHIATSRHDIASKNLINGQKYFFIRNPAHKVLNEKIIWQYTVSNRIALNRKDILHRENRHSYSSTIKPNEEVISHLIHFKTRTLKLECMLPDLTTGDKSVFKQNLRAVAERAQIKGGSVEWQTDYEETHKIQIFFDAKSNTITMIAEYPCVGYRYSIIFVPSDHTYTPCTESQHLLSTVTEKCLSDEKTDKSENNNFRDRLVTCIEKVFLKRQESTLDDIEISGYLWSDDHHKLEVCFGRMQPKRWSKSFKYGEGLAGHAFRFNNVATYHKKMGSSAIFVPIDNENYAWMVCAPIYPAYPTNAKPLGVISFGSSLDSSPNPLVNQLAFHARYCCENSEIFSQQESSPLISHAPEIKKRLEFNKFLISVVNIGFWNCLGSLENDELQEYVNMNLNQFEVDDA